MRLAAVFGFRLPIRLQTADAMMHPFDARSWQLLGGNALRNQSQQMAQHCQAPCKVLECMLLSYRTLARLPADRDLLRLV